MSQTITAESLQSDSNIKDMAFDLEESMAFGDPITTWFNEDGTPQDWFVEAAGDEFARRNGEAVDGRVVAEALYALITE